MAQEEFELKDGQVFAGYRVVQKLGPGVMGVVYLARDTSAVQRIALKILQPGLAGDEEYVKQFEEQAAAAVAVSHNNVAQFYAAGREHGVLYTASEFIPGDTLAARIERQGRLDPQIALSLLMTIGKALSFLHSRGIVHGGVNPGNIRMTTMGEVKLVDAGLAKKLALRPRESEVKGSVTPVYLAPELIDRTTRIDERADVYSLGITAYEALTGNIPFKGGTPHETVLRIMNEPLKPEDMRGVPPGIARLVARMTAKEPEDRPSSMDEVLSEMERLAASVIPVVVGAAPSASAKLAITKKIAKRRLTVVLYILLTVAVVATFLAFTLEGCENDQPSQTAAADQQAARSLEEARKFEQENGATAEVLEKYRGVVRAFPGTDEAVRAKDAERRLIFSMSAEKADEMVAADRLFEAMLVYDEFEKNSPGMEEGAEAGHRKNELQSRIENRFNGDVLDAARLVQQGDTDAAIALLQKAEVYGTPAIKDKAREETDKIRRLAGSVALEGAYVEAWEAARPMLAVMTRQIADYDYRAAEASCASFLESPLPEGVSRIMRWEQEDIGRLLKVEENFAAAAGDAANRGTETSFTLADGTSISGIVKAHADGYYLHIGEDRVWRIRTADLAPSGVLKLAGMEVKDRDAILTSMLYELYHGSMRKARSLLSGMAGTLGEEQLNRYENKIRVLSALPSRGAGSANLDPREIRRAAQIVEGARGLVKEKEWDRAYPLLKQAVGINPGEPDAWGLLAKAAAQKALPAEAVQYYRRALALSPGNAIFWNELGRLYLSLGELGLALAAFGQSARMNPADTLAAEGRIEALLRLGRDEEASRVRQEWEKARQK
jgi:tetratricopeptide (TPR) repeat protein